MGELKVYYGWAKVGKIRKKRAISVMFENEWHGCRCERGQRVLRAAQETVFERYQDEEEEKAAKNCSRIFTEITNIGYALNQIQKLADMLKIDILWPIAQQRKYNERRPYNHGNKNY